MAFELTPLTFEEWGSALSITLINNGSMGGGTINEKAEFTPLGVYYDTKEGDPAVWTRRFVPWSNIAEIAQSPVTP